MRDQTKLLRTALLMLVMAAVGMGIALYAYVTEGIQMTFALASVATWIALFVSHVCVEQLPD